MAETTPTVLRKWKMFSQWPDEELEKVEFVKIFAADVSSGDPSKLAALVLNTEGDAFHVGNSCRFFGGGGGRDELTKTKADAVSGLNLKKIECGGAFCVGLTKDGRLYRLVDCVRRQKIPDDAYICYDTAAYGVSPCSCGESDEDRLNIFEFAKITFVYGCVDCTKGLQTGAQPRGNAFVKLVKFQEAAIRCTKCRRRCVGYKLGDYDINYCPFCNYLPQGVEYYEMPPKTIEGPELLDIGEGNKVVDVACGNEFFVILTNQNCLILWGKLQEAKYKGAVYNPNNAIIKAVSCGGYHVAVLSIQGELYTCGQGDKGQLGYDWKREMGYETLRKVPLPGKVSKVCCGNTSTVCLLEDGALMCFGSNMKMMSADVLALNQKDSDCISNPARIMLAFKFTDIVNSPLTNIYWARTDTMMFTWGKETEDSPQPTLVLGECCLVAAMADLPASLSFKTPPASLSTMSPHQHSELYGNAFLSDLTLKLSDGEFPAHRLVLYTNSAYFRNVFENDGGDCTLDMSVYNPTAYKSLLKYFYQVPPTDLSASDLFDLYVLASSYKETDIERELFAKLKTTLNPETVLPLLRKAKEVNCKEFLDECNVFVQSPEFKHILAEKVSKDLDQTLSVLEVVSFKKD